MRVISKPIIRTFCEAHKDAQLEMDKWFLQTEKARWASFADLRATFPLSDIVKGGNGRVVFNVRGNSYRIVALVDFERFGVLIRFVGTHAEYDKLTDKQMRTI